MSLIDMSLIDVSAIAEIPDEYPDEFNAFCLNNCLKPPNISSKNGKALSVMLNNKNHYWNRKTCDELVKKFNIETKDSIQLFNKHWVYRPIAEKKEVVYILFIHMLCRINIK